MKYFLTRFVLLVFIASPALAGGAGPMWVFPVARLCVAQEPKYAETFLGKWISQSRLKLESEQFAQCARTKQWIPAHICTELMSLETDKDLGRSNLERLGAKFGTELRVLSTAGLYVMQASEALEAGRELPACP